MRVGTYEGERRPVYRLDGPGSVPGGVPGGVPCDVPPKALDRWRAALGAFEKAQDEMRVVEERCEGRERERRLAEAERGEPGRKG